jgi:zinc protease
MAIAITRATLPNGLRVILVKDPSARDVQITMRYAVGDVNDPVGQDGVAHLVEHMMFETKIDTATKTVFAKLEAISTAFNGMTSHDATTYVERGAMDKLDAMLGVEMTRLVSPCSTWTQAGFERERAAVANEQRENDQGRNLVGVLERAIFPVGHPYTRAGKTTEVGVASLTLEQACAFADAHYTPGNAALVVAGNLSETDLGEAIDRTLGQLPARAATAPAVDVTQDNPTRHLTSSAPLSFPAVMLAWPLPTDPAEQIRALAIAQRMESWIDTHTPGSTFQAQLGDARAPMFVVIAPVGAQSTNAVMLAQLRAALVGFAREMRKETRRTELAFTMLKQSAGARLFRAYEEDSDRDARLAAYALAGGDPAELVSKEVRSLRSMTQEEAASIAEDTFGFAQAVIVDLAPTQDVGSKKHIALVAPDRDPGLTRSQPDANAAAVPAPASTIVDAGGSATIKTLPNGLTLVLLPLTSVPTVDIRLVFHSGTANEDPAKRGAALVAANALTLDSAYLDDVATFAEAGGSSSARVTYDATTFSVSGLDMHVDYLLRGLRRLVVDSRYDEAAHTVVAALRAAAKTDSDDSLGDAWRAAVYGEEHPYTVAGVADKASTTLRVADAEAFRRLHYTPGNATLIIAGHFNAALADQWVEYLFGDWRASATPPAVSTAATLTPASFVRDAEGELVELRLALPAAHGTRAQRLIAAQMLQAIVDDIRHQLSASYGVDVRYDEHVSSTMYSVDGRVLATRAADALILIRDRLAQLRSDPDAAARAFVDARDRVLVELGENVASAARIAASVESDVTMQRPPLSSRKNAEDVRTTTIAGMNDVFADLDLAKAAILLVGPHDSTNDAFAALDRIATPITVKAELTEEVAAEAPAASYLRELELERRERNPPGRFGWNALGGALVGQLLQGDVAGGSGSGAGLWNFGNLAIGVQLSAGYLAGTYTRTDQGVTMSGDLSALAFGGDLLLQAVALDRLWAAPLVGVHANSIKSRGDRVWRVSPCFGGQLGVDVYKRGTDRVSLFARYETEIEPKDSLFVWTFGVGLRR